MSIESINLENVLISKLNKYAKAIETKRKFFDVELMPAIFKLD